MIVHQHVDSPVGPLLLAADADFLRAIWFPTPRYLAPLESSLRAGDNDVLQATRAQLGEYFAGPPANVRVALGTDRHTLSARRLGAARADSLW